jgi:hypothetical protein
MVKRVRLKSKRVRLTPEPAKRIGKKVSGKRPSVHGKESESSKGDYEVGKYRPPLHTRFKKGDGRKRPGRPKGSKNIATLVLDAADTQVDAIIDGKKRKISKKQSAAIRLANAGAMGDPKLLLKFIDLIAEIEARAEAARPSEYPFSDVDIEVIREIYKRLRPYDERVSD